MRVNEEEKSRRFYDLSLPRPGLLRLVVSVDTWTILSTGRFGRFHFTNTLLNISWNFWILKYISFTLGSRRTRMTLKLPSALVWFPSLFCVFFRCCCKQCGNTTVMRIIKKSQQWWWERKSWTIFSTLQRQFCCCILWFPSRFCTLKVDPYIQGMIRVVLWEKSSKMFSHFSEI